MNQEPAKQKLGRVENQYDFKKLAAKEWLVTNGIGGFAAGTLSGANTRRYHGLLVAALNPPTSRTVMVSKMEETIRVADQAPIHLSSNEYPGLIHPDGFKYLREFERDPYPTFHFEVGSIALKKCIVMPHGMNASVVEYMNTGVQACELTLRLFLTYRDYHQLLRENPGIQFVMTTVAEKEIAIVAGVGSVPLHVGFTSGRFTEDRDWYRNYKYRHETYRGLDDEEDVFTPGYVRAMLQPGDKVTTWFVAGEPKVDWNPETSFAVELDRIHTLRKEMMIEHTASRVSQYFHPGHCDVRRLLADMVVSADQFIVYRPSSGGKTIIAGYHWFTDWGRDTMIAMRGLVIARGHKALSESIIKTFLQYLDRGMLPNRFPDAGEVPEYNTIDATLWLFIVLHEYAEQFADYGFIREILPLLSSIIEHHIQGTRYNIHMLENGLLYGGEDHVQLTWMDAKVGDHVFTPRMGCPVEINALWYNALMIYADFVDKCQAGENRYASLAGQVRESFIQSFYNGKYLHDVVSLDGKPDDAIRPNQVYAVSLPYDLLDGKQTAQVLSTIESHLLTPMGLRSLSPHHPDFISTYGGNVWSRDSAYHQGTVWSYLIGEYCLAFLKQHAYSDKAKQAVAAMMIPIIQHFYEEDCIWGINEIFDGQEPKEGRGCVNQAWSVGMMIKVIRTLA